MKVWGNVVILLAGWVLCAASRTQTPSTAPSPIRTFQDPSYRASFDYPANWTFSHIDGEISTFRLDARSAPANTVLRAVVAMPENPFPASTFSGAYFYFSVAPHTSAAACTDQAKNTTLVNNFPQVQPGDKIKIGDILFTHGHDEQKEICISQRDEVYTVFRRGTCYRFDLAINNFCGPEVSGIKDITSAELDEVRARLQSILSTVRLDPN